MKQLLIILLSCFCVINYTSAQQPKHKLNSRAKALNDTAAARYQRSAGDPEKIKKVITILDDAIKIDDKYYEAWNNKLALLDQLDQFEDAYKTLKKMELVFPKQEEVWFNLGILEFKTNRTKDALATWNKLLVRYNELLEKNKNNANTKGLLYNKGIVLILTDKQSEGKAILNKLYNQESEPYVKSSIAFYINSSRIEIINDRIPGK